MVVLPVPGGPQKTIEDNVPLFSIRRNRPSGPINASCPTTSSSFCGRIRSANGIASAEAPKSSSFITT
jgi:hypothetical protein